MNNNNNNPQPPPALVSRREETHRAIMQECSPILHRLGEAVDALLHHHATARETAFPDSLMNELAEATAQWENQFLHVQAIPQAIEWVNGHRREMYDVPYARTHHVTAGDDVRVPASYGDGEHPVDGTVIRPVAEDNRCYVVDLHPQAWRGDSPNLIRRVTVPENQMEVYW